MNDTPEPPARILPELERQLHSGLEVELILNCIGTAGAGKSTFLAGAHQELGYSNIGARIMRGRPRNLSGLMSNRLKGVTRSNATVRDVDQMEVYGITQERLVRMELYAPGSHYCARDLTHPEDAAAYFLDAYFLQRVLSLIEKEAINFFPFQDFGGRHPAGYVPKLEMKKVKVQFDQMPEVFKGTEIGIIIESLLCVQENLVALKERGVPVIGIQTYPSENQGGLSLPVGAAFADGIFNTLIKTYFEYLKENGFPNYSIGGGTL